MKIAINESEAGLGREIPFSFETDAEKLGVIHPDYSFKGSIKVQGTLVNTGRAYRVSGVIFCLKSFVCDRCLAESEEKQEHHFSENYQRGEAEAAEDSQDMNYFNGDAIDIADMIRDTLIAAQPLSSICSPDCRGLCPVCGANLNEGDCGCDTFIPDPRLAALQSLLKKKMDD